MDSRITRIQSLIRDVPDFPKPGVTFKDITPVLGDALAFHTCIDLLAERFADDYVETVVGIESRGFVFAAALAYRLRAGFTPVRKPGKLPANVHRIDYDLEYGTDAVEMHRDALGHGQRALIVDDVLATGGTARATADLVQELGGDLVGYGFVLELGFLDGARHLTDAPVLSLVRA